MHHQHNLWFARRYTLTDRDDDLMSNGTILIENKSPSTARGPIAVGQLPWIAVLDPVLSQERVRNTPAAVWVAGSNVGRGRCRCGGRGKA